MSDTIDTMTTDSVKKAQGERLAALRKNAGWRSAASAAQNFGWPESTYRAHENGTRTIGHDDAERYAKAYRSTGKFILYGEGDLPTASEVPPARIPGADLVGDKDLPVFAAAMGGKGHLIVSFDPIDYVRRPTPLLHVKGAYGILITGESMVPAFRPGDIALVSPRMPPDRGQDVVLYHTPPNGEAEAIVKHLTGWTDDKWKLEQYNPAKKFNEDRHDWPVCHWVVGKYNRR